MERTRTNSPEAADAERIRLEGRVELLESARARYASILAALTDRWWERLPAIDALVTQTLREEAKVTGAEPAVARAEAFTAIVSSARQEREALVARVLELTEPGGSWAEGLAGLHRQALTQAQPPPGDQRPLMAPRVRGERRDALLLALVPLLASPWILPVGLSPLVLVAYACVILAWATMREWLAPWQLFPNRLFVQPRNGPPFELPLETSTARREDSALVVAHADKTLTVPEAEGAELLAALIDLGRAGLLAPAAPTGNSQPVIGGCRSEAGDWGSLILLLDRVVFLPHQQAAAMMSSLTGQPPIARHTADVVLESLSFVPALLVASLLSRVPAEVGLRLWRRSEVSVASDLLPRNEDTSAGREGGSVTLTRGSELIEVRGTFEALDWLLAGMRQPR